MAFDPIAVFGDILPNQIFEKPDSGELIWSRENGWEGTRIFFTRFEDALNLCPPPRSPYNRFFPHVICRRIQFKPYGPINELTREPKYCEITVSYGSRAPLNNPVETIRASVEALETTKGRTWVSDSSPCEDHKTSLYLQAEINVEISSESFEKEIVLPLIGKVNSGPYLGCGAGTLLFIGPDVQTEWDSFDGTTVRTVYQFLWRENGHNRVWRDSKPGGAGWDELYPPLHESADFSVLGLE